MNLINLKRIEKLEDKKYPKFMVRISVGKDIDGEDIYRETKPERGTCIDICLEDAGNA